MAKVYTYVFVVTGIMMLLYMAGIPTTSGYVLQWLDPINNPEGIRNTFLLIAIAGALTAMAAAGSSIKLGFVQFVASPVAAMVPVAIILLLFIGDMISIITYYNGLYGTTEWQWVGYLIDLLLFPVVLGFALSILSWVQGGDN